MSSMLVSRLWLWLWLLPTQEFQTMLSSKNEIDVFEFSFILVEKWLESFKPHSRYLARERNQGYYYLQRNSLSDSDHVSTLTLTLQPISIDHQSPNLPCLACSIVFAFFFYIKHSTLRSLR